MVNFVGSLTDGITVQIFYFSSKHFQIYVKINRGNLKQNAEVDFKEAGQNLWINQYIL